MWSPPNDLPVEQEDVQKKAEVISKMISPDEESSDEEPAIANDASVQPIKTDPDAPKVPFWVGRF